MTTVTMSLEEMEFANKQAWDRLYGTTEKLIWGDEPLLFVREAFEKIAPLLPKSPLLLDAATGEGRNLPFLFERSERVVACDASPKAIEKLHARFEQRVKTFVCDLAAMPFDAETFDAVLACDVIETLPNLSDVLAELFRVVKTGGFLICNVPDNRDGIVGENMRRLDTDEYLYQDRFYFRFQRTDDFFGYLSDNGLKRFDDFTATWTEEAHPEYRGDRHSHTSQIIIARKA